MRTTTRVLIGSLLCVSIAATDAQTSMAPEKRNSRLTPAATAAPVMVEQAPATKAEVTESLDTASAKEAPAKVAPWPRSPADIVRTAAPEGPDLKVGEVWLERPDLQVRVEWDPSKGSQYKFVCTFANAGLDTAGYSTIGHYLDGRLVRSESLWGGFNPGAKGTSSWIYDPADQVVGAHVYECALDIESDLTEPNEGNNRARLAFNLVEPAVARNCKSDRECDTGVCADGVCCDQKCDGNCRYCAFPGRMGFCTAVPDGQDPRRACQGAVGGHPACSGKCFSGQCAFPDVGSDCGLCSACDGTGRCVLPPSDDDDCGVIACSALNSQERTYYDLTANRCAALGTCKQANDPATCTQWRDHR